MGLTVETLGTISGYVLNESQLPVEEATVYVAQGPSHHDIASLTDSDGHYEISGLAPGHYVLHAKFGNKAFATKAVDLQAGSNLRVDFHFAGDAVDELDGEP